jgi:hypothetical protein
VCSKRGISCQGEFISIIKKYWVLLGSALLGLKYEPPHNIAENLLKMRMNKGWWFGGIKFDLTPIAEPIPPAIRT